MGTRVMRVPMDFDWPMGRVWPGHMVSICAKEVRLCVGSGATDEEVCEACRHFGRLVGLSEMSGCPNVRVPPPEGDGWQLWEVVTEGSPISPVFATHGELVQWMQNRDRRGHDGHPTD